MRTIARTRTETMSTSERETEGRDFRIGNASQAHSAVDGFVNFSTCQTAMDPVIYHHKPSSEREPSRPPLLDGLTADQCLLAWTAQQRDYQTVVLVVDSDQVAPGDLIRAVDGDRWARLGTVVETKPGLDAPSVTIRWPDGGSLAEHVLSSGSRYIVERSSSLTPEQRRVAAALWSRDARARASRGEADSSRCVRVDLEVEPWE